MTAATRAELAEARRQKHAEAEAATESKAEYTAATLALRGAEVRRDGAMAELGALRAENGRLGGLQGENDKLGRLLERETRRADEADGRLRVASEQLEWAIPAVRVTAHPNLIFQGIPPNVPV